MTGEMRRRVLAPALIPVTAVVLIGAAVFGFSRLLLAATEGGSIALAGVATLAILLTAAALARGGSLKAAQKAALGVGFVALVSGGTLVGATVGIRPIAKHAPPADITLVAKNNLWDLKEIKVPAGRSTFVIRLVNQDSGVPHNVSIYKTKDLEGQVFDGGTAFAGVAEKTYEIPVPPPGVYYFICDVHPSTMVGTFVVGEGAAPGSAPGAPSPAAAPAGQSMPGMSHASAMPGSSDERVSLTARDMAFDMTSIVMHAGVKITLSFTNADAGIPHNFVIRDSAGRTVFRTPTFTGPATKEFTFTAPPAGNYTFVCDLHPNMKGTILTH